MKDVANSKRKANSNTSQQGTRKKRRRKKNFSLYYITCFLAISCALTILSLTVFFKINKITVTGSSKYSQEEIIFNSGIQSGENLIRTNTQKAEEMLLTNLVDIESVKIVRKLPSEIIIEVTPVVPYAVLQVEGLYYVVDKNLKIIEDKLSQPLSDLVVINGFEPESCQLNTVATSADEQKGGIVTQLIALINESGISGIKSIDITDRLNIVLNYQERISIEIGSSIDMDYKIKFIKNVLEDKENITDDFTGRIIVRGNNGISVIREENCLQNSLNN